MTDDAIVRVVLPLQKLGGQLLKLMTCSTVEVDFITTDMLVFSSNARTNKNDIDLKITMP